MTEPGATPLVIDGDSLTVGDVVAVAREGRPAALSQAARARMERSWQKVVEAGRRDAPIYGVNTGFGSLARVRIGAADQARLALNLVRSHAAGVGPEVSADVVRAMMLLRANALAKGFSGCRPALVDTLLALLDRGLLPVVPARGSCGSSGDLAPLAHLALVLVGDPRGQAVLDGERLPADRALARAGIAPLRLMGKDGLALTNGAQLSTAFAVLACHDAARLVLYAELAAAMSIEALLGASRAFHPAVHALRPYPGARACAANLRALMRGSTLIDSVPDKVQDAYALRCTPQVVGAARDAIAYATSQVSVEINSATDNPLILPDREGENPAFSAGLFHGEAVGMAMDVLKIGVAEMAAIAERRLYRLTTGTLSQHLPPGLARADRPGLGLMLPQATAAALVSESKALGWPASLDSIPTCEDQEDHVAMSTTAARRAARVVDNARYVVAIELLGAASALAIRREQDPAVRLGEGTGRALDRISAELGGFDPSRPPADDIERLVALMASDELLPDGLFAVGEAP